MKKSVRYTLLVIVIIAAVPIFIALFTDYEVNKVGEGIVVCYYNNYGFSNLFPEKERRVRA